MIQLSLGPAVGFTELPFDLTVNPSTGDVGVSGYYGAFGVLSAGGEWTTYRLTDMEADIEYIMYSTDYKDQDGFYGGGFNVDGFGIYRFDLEQKDWVKKGAIITDTGSTKLSVVNISQSSPSFWCFILNFITQ